jgi:hypothetical protein
VDERVFFEPPAWIYAYTITFFAVRIHFQTPRLNLLSFSCLFDTFTFLTIHAYEIVNEV